MFSKLVPSICDRKKLHFFPPILHESQSPGTGSPTFPLNAPASHLRGTFNGTAAIYQAARAMDLQPGDKVLMPAYCCGAELGPFQHLQCEIEFFRVDDDLQVNVEDLVSRIDAKTRLVYVTHYFGLPQKQIQELSRLCREHNVFLLEDCALALYCSDSDQPLGSYGDYAIFSQRKFLSITEGGMLVSNRRPLPEDMRTGTRPPVIPSLDRYLSLVLRGEAKRSSSSPIRTAFTAMLLLLSIAIKLIRVLGQAFLARWKTPDVEGVEAVPLYASSMTSFSARRFRDTNAELITQQRREVFDTWLQVADGLPNCEPLIGTLPDGVCPLYFLLLADNETAKQRLLELLADRGIEASEWWASELDEIDWQEHKHLLPIKCRLVVVPTHHHIRAADLLERFSPEPINASELTEESSAGQFSTATVA